MGCLSGCLMSSASIQKLFFFFGICSAFKGSFDEFVGEKVVSPSYSSAIQVLIISVFYHAHPCMKCSLDISNCLEEIRIKNDRW